MAELGGGGAAAGDGPGGETRATPRAVVPVPLGRIAGARSGDKGGNANLGVWARSPAGFAWLDAFLTTDRLRALLPETAELEIRRHPFPNLLALNFELVGLLGEGVAASVRPDPQAKGLGEQLRACPAEIPQHLVDEAATCPP